MLHSNKIVILSQPSGDTIRSKRGQNMQVRGSITSREYSKYRTRIYTTLFVFASITYEMFNSSFLQYFFFLDIFFYNYLCLYICCQN